MDLNAEEIRKFLERTTFNRTEAIHTMLNSDRSCGLLEVWDYATRYTGNEIVLSYKLDPSVPYGEIHTIVKDDSFETNAQARLVETKTIIKDPKIPEHLRRFQADYVEALRRHP